jgi:hypothetical protein
VDLSHLSYEPIHRSREGNCPSPIWVGGVAQPIEGLPTKREALSSNPSPTENKNKKTQKQNSIRHVDQSLCKAKAVVQPGKCCVTSWFSIQLGRIELV